MSTGGPWAAAPLALALLCGCSDGDAVRALEAAAPFREDHARFARWAERTLESESAHPRDRADLEETLFAPLFLESDVVAAEVHHTVRDTRHSYGEPLPELTWQTAREGARELQVATTGGAVALATTTGPYTVTILYRARSADER